jgi:5-methylcytosine-specific restriction endonuclease McrA
MTCVAASANLAASVLVLNRFYMAVHVISVRRAFALLVRELAEVIHLEEEGQYANYDFESWREISALREAFVGPHDDWIQAVNFRIQVPRVIRLLVYDRTPKQTVRFNRRNVFARDANHCQYCGRSFPTSELSLDHVIPRSQGGPTCWENIVCSCVGCNVRKGGRTPQQAHMKLVRPPAKPKRSPLLTLKLGNPKYESWKTFLNDAYWSVDLK